MKVSKIMNARPKTVEPHQSLADAVAIMVDRDCGWVPVVDAGGRVVGVVTDRDICLAAHDRDTRIRSIAVEGVMRTNVQSCHHDDTIQDAEAKMRSSRVRRLPVVDDDGKLVGLLSLSDLARQAGMNDRDIPKGLTSVDIAHTLAAICEPRSADGAA
ncbi:MAG: CBS domain-containing protein [Myxococcales bacterium]|nr:CBS domain-containing protein [Myxococcales bacterium]